MRATINAVKKWIEELKKRGIGEFQFSDLPDDLRQIGLLRKASVLKEIEALRKVGHITIWKVK